MVSNSLGRSGHGTQNQEWPGHTGETIATTTPLLVLGLVNAPEGYALTISWNSQTSTRHTVGANDSLVALLTQLETRYANDPENLAKTRSIIVHPDSLEIGGIRIRREDTTLTLELLEHSSIDQVQIIADGASSQDASFFAAKSTENVTPDVLTLTGWMHVLGAIPGKFTATNSPQASISAEWMQNAKMILGIRSGYMKRHDGDRVTEWFAYRGYDDIGPQGYDSAITIKSDGNGGGILFIGDPSMAGNFLRVREKAVLKGDDSHALSVRPF